MGNEASSQNITYGQRLNNDVSVEWTKIDCDNPFPSRYGHTACGVGDCLYVFGGVVCCGDDDDIVESSDLLKFNLESRTWSKADVKGHCPAPRTAATMTAVESSTWTEIDSTSGPSPSPRDKVASVAIETKLYIFGGFGPRHSSEEMLGGSSQGSQEESEDDMEDEAGPEAGPDAEFRWFDDLFVYDTEKNQWEKIAFIKMHSPTPRAAHGMCAVGTNILIFGGRDTQCRRNDLYLLDTESMKWIDVTSTGRQPEPRSFHTVTSVGNRMIVIGGRSQDNTHFNDFHIFDTVTKEWMQPSLTGNLPTERGVHTVTVVDKSLVLFGGSSQFNDQTMECQQYFSDVHVCKIADILSGKSLPTLTEDNIAAQPMKEVPNTSGSVTEMVNGKSNGTEISQ
uniref:Kelch domain-containing protein 1-like n=1 Tax=Saccoglossus kowalevskii TaxID=10224 RepID=A0ABM0ML22_SACKO|nr:PREDICTED: kelch domain-containing protein 1-like [Saccoglossus kowalevskii]